MASGRAYGLDLAMSGKPHVTKNGKNFIRKSEISGKIPIFFYGKICYLFNNKFVMFCLMYHTLNNTGRTLLVI